MIRITKGRKYEITQDRCNPVIKYPQLIDNLHFSSAQDAYYFIGRTINTIGMGENRVTITDDQISMLNRSTGECMTVPGVDNRWVTLCVNYGVIAMGKFGGSMKVIAEHDHEEVLFQEILRSPAYPGGSISGLTMREIGGEFFLYVSRNGHYCIIFQIVEKGDSFTLEHFESVNIGHHLNSISFGNGEYCNYIMGCLDDSVRPYVAIFDELGNLGEKIDLQDTFNGEWISSMHSCWAPSGNLVAMGTEESFCVVWDISTTEIVKLFDNLEAPVRLVKFSPNEDVPLLAFSVRDAVILTETIGWTYVRIPLEESICGMNFSKNGDILALSTNSGILELLIESGVPSLSSLVAKYIGANEELLPDIPYDLIPEHLMKEIEFHRISYFNSTPDESWTLRTFS